MKTVCNSWAPWKLGLYIGGPQIMVNYNDIYSWAGYNQSDLHGWRSLNDLIQFNYVYMSVKGQTMNLYVQIYDLVYKYEYSFGYYLKVIYGGRFEKTILTVCWPSYGHCNKSVFVMNP